jgi:hypothetical protein
MWFEGIFTETTEPQAMSVLIFNIHYVDNRPMSSILGVVFESKIGVMLL